jgi:bleomycin hydrolase
MKIRSASAIFFSIGYLALSFNAMAAPPTPVNLSSLCDSIASGELSLDFIKIMQDHEAMADPRLQALRKDLLKMPINQAFLNRELVANTTYTYSTELKCDPALDQHGIGFCHIFGIEALLRYSMPNKMPQSDTYLGFYHFFEQYNEIQNEIIDSGITSLANRNRDALTSSISQGGYFQWDAHLLNKYGTVPKFVMPDTYSILDPTTMMADLNRESNYTTKLLVEAAARGATAKEKGEIKLAGMTRFWTLLVTYLGVPPSEFEVPASALVEQPPALPAPDLKPKNDFVNPMSIGTVSLGRVVEKKAPETAPASPETMVKFTPLDFMKKFTNFDADTYITVGSYPQLEENKFYSFKKGHPGNNDPGAYTTLQILNVSVSRMKELLKETLASGVPVPFASDVTVDVDNATGIGHPQIYLRSEAFGLTPEEWAKQFTRKEMNLFQLSQADHEMTFLGFNQTGDMSEPDQYDVLNSWGANVGIVKDKNGVSKPGHLCLKKEWLDKNLYEISIPRKQLSPAENEMTKDPHSIDKGHTL